MRTSPGGRTQQAPSAGEPGAITVLHVIPSLAIGGTERQLVEYVARSSAPDRHVLAVFDEEGALADRIPVRPANVGPLGRRMRDLPSDLRAIKRLRRLIQCVRPDVVHAHLGVAEVLAAAAVPPRIPLVASHRGRNVGLESRAVFRQLERLAHRRARLLVCNSRYLAERTARLDPRAPPIQVVYNAVDLEAFRPLPYPSLERPTVAMVANFGRDKGHGVLLRALELLRARTPAVRAILLGDGPERPRMQYLARRLGLDDVLFAGQVLDIRPFVADAHVVALTSHHEGFPNALLEGMAMGRPVVATRVGGVPELVRHLVDGILVAAGNAFAVAEALDAVLTSPDRLRAMGAAASNQASEFGWDRLVGETEQTYLWAVRHGARRRQER
jgi:glycosyltransferase involved in cell wall biosynthesis